MPRPIDCFLCLCVNHGACDVPERKPVKIHPLSLPLSLAIFFLLAFGAAGAEPSGFKKIQLTDKFWCEGANFADINRDGFMDIVSGPYWYEGPDFKKRHEYRPAKASFKLRKDDGSEITIEGFEGALSKKNGYSDDFLTFIYDFNGDGWPDILVIGLPGTPAIWYENPQGKPGPWTPHLAFNVVDNESPVLTDIDGCGKPELICHKDGYLGYAKPDWNNPNKMWTFHRISPKGTWHKYTHGLGVGDVNGDGRMDMILADGWWSSRLPWWVIRCGNFISSSLRMAGPRCTPMMSMETA